MELEGKQTDRSSAVDLIIRFTTSAPDLVLTISQPHATSALSLKQLIRSHLSDDVSTSRLRLIAAGKVLTDSRAISASLHIPPRPPQSSDIKGKGKAPLRDSPPPTPNPRVYIHCSVGDALSASELRDESTAAADADAALRSTATSDAPTARNESRPAISTTTAAPRGFDRLLDSGFSAAEVAALRAQFMAVLAHSHTPDSMPSGDDLRILEDRWLDNDAGGGAASGRGGAGQTDGLGGDDEGLDDMLWGNIMGFFWPVAAVCWLMREDGVWSNRRQIAVLSGMIINLTFGFLRLTT
ncbi:hypothetical protein ANO11243_024780 [Dothideomycetidae sp. 11243]|nr:hypothetical protein ANO11243_024780 [fungal sp. No.11243]